MAGHGVRLFHTVRRHPLIRAYSRHVYNSRAKCGRSDTLLPLNIMRDCHGATVTDGKSHLGLVHNSMRGLSSLVRPAVDQVLSNRLTTKPRNPACTIGSRLWALPLRRNYGVTTRDEHGVYLVGYTLPEGQSDTDFVAEWEEATRKLRQQPGFMYQELCRHVQEWTEQIPGVLEPLPVTFVDFMVFQSLDVLTNCEELTQEDSMLKQLVSRSKGVVGRFSVAISVVKDMAKPDQVLMYNLFEVEDDRSASFIATVSWPRRQEYHSSQPGFVSATLHQRADESSRFALFNRAEWASAEEYLRSARRIADAIPIEPAQERPGAVRSFPGIFETVRTFAAEEVPSLEASP